MALRDIIRASKARIAPPAPTTFDIQDQRVLILYLFPGLGDVILLLPVLEALLKKKPREVGVLVRQRGADVLALYARSIRVHILPDALTDPSQMDATHRADARVSRESSAEHRARLLDELTGQYDVAVDLTHRKEIDARAIMQDAQIPTRIGLISQDEAIEPSTMHACVLDDRHLPYQHWSKHVTGGLRNLGVSEPSYDVPFEVSAACRRKARTLYGPSASRNLLLVPGSKYTEKRWSLDAWEQAVRALTQHTPMNIVVTGAPWEATAMRACAQRLGARSYCGQDLQVLLALVESADLVLGNDTGPMHFACLLRRPTITVFLQMSPTVWGAPGPHFPYLAFEGAPPLEKLVQAAIERLP